MHQFQFVHIGLFLLSVGRREFVHAVGQIGRERQGVKNEF